METNDKSEICFPILSIADLRYEPNDDASDKYWEMRNSCRSQYEEKKFLKEEDTQLIVNIWRPKTSDTPFRSLPLLVTLGLYFLMSTQVDKRLVMHDFTIRLLGSEAVVSEDEVNEFLAEIAEQEFELRQDISAEKE